VQNLDREMETKIAIKCVQLKDFVDVKRDSKGFFFLSLLSNKNMQILIAH
jgi:hypothetical protein